jgi:hypothetical protein
MINRVHEEIADKHAVIARSEAPKQSTLTQASVFPG